MKLTELKGDFELKLRGRMNHYTKQNIVELNYMLRPTTQKQCLKKLSVVYGLGTAQFTVHCTQYTVQSPGSLGMVLRFVGAGRSGLRI